MRKRTKLKTALLLAATVNVSYAAEVCFPPAEGQEFYEVLQCFQNGLDSQQKQITALETENQRLTTLISSSKSKLDSQQKRIAALETENQRLTTLITSSKSKLDSQQNRIAALEKENQRFHTLRYFDNGDGTVTDNTQSGLTWLKNANCFGRQYWERAKQSAARLRSGQCGLRDGSKAGMWRLPTRDEWVRMVDKRYQKPALSNRAGTAQWKEGDAFSGVRAYSYWSSTESASYGDFAWAVYFGDGYVNTHGKASTDFVWPVRRRQ